MKHQPRKRFGQNFLVELNVISKIISHVKAGKNIVEIGPGLGALTEHLIKKTKLLNVIEIDRDLAQHLQQQFQDNIIVHQSDVLKFDFNQLALAPLTIIGNLPYNISTPLLFHLIKYIDNVDSMYFMLQKEVVERIVAKVNSKNYGRLSVMLQYYCHTEKLFDVPASAFNPPPKVESAVIFLQPKTDHKLAINNRHFANTVKQAFSQPRKTIYNNLKVIIDKASLENLGIDPTTRPQTLTVSDYACISNYITQHDLFTTNKKSTT